MGLSLEGQAHWPVFRNYLVDAGMGKWPEGMSNFDWKEAQYESVVWPLIPYADNNLDMGNSYKSPFDPQKVKAPRFRHRLGTDSLGRDVAAGMIRGTRVALVIGLLSMAVAAFIGILLGALAGYYGDRHLQVSRVRVLLNVLALPLAYFYAVEVRSYVLEESSNFYTQLLISLGWAMGIILLANLLATLLKRLPWLGRKWTMPVDILVMRLIEVMNSIPGLMLLLAILVIIPRPNVFSVMVIIGVISWTGIARFIRGEILRIRALEYIEAARAMGYSNWRIIWRHVIPNALGPVLITLAFGIAGAILLEAFLSFLGQGAGSAQVTWGRLLSLARNSPGAWWLAVFPGLAIFVTVSIFNFIGEGLTDAIDPRRG
ncbi:MAG: ABC transporter permease [Bacteroidota bacterium]